MQILLRLNLPDYWTGLVDEETITVELTPIGKHQKLYVKDIADNVVTIGNDNVIKKEINCFYGKKPAPFGVNLIVHPTNIRVKADLDVCEKHKVPLIITSLGAVPQIVDIIHNYGGLVYHDIIKKRHAEKFFK